MFTGHSWSDSSCPSNPVNDGSWSRTLDTDSAKVVERSYFHSASMLTARGEAAVFLISCTGAAVHSCPWCNGGDVW